MQSQIGQMEFANIEGWTEKKKILVILAHPDDPEFFCGGMIARWCTQGHDVNYCLLTKGQRGSQDVDLTVADLEKIRISEQNASARLLGVTNVEFLNYMDGELVPELGLREDVIKIIRRNRPEIVVTSDPQNLFQPNNRINHPDHRAAGQVVTDAVFPAAGNPRICVMDASNKPIPPHEIEELWVTLTQQPNLTVDVTQFFNIKLDAIACHRSQLHDTPEELKEKMRLRFELDPDSGIMKYYEKFRRIQLIIK